MKYGTAIAKQDIDFNTAELSWGYFKRLATPPKILPKGSEFIIRGYKPDWKMFAIDVDGALITFNVTEEKFRELFMVKLYLKEN